MCAKTKGTPARPQKLAVASSADTHLLQLPQRRRADTALFEVPRRLCHDLLDDLLIDIALESPVSPHSTPHVGIGAGLPGHRRPHTTRLFVILAERMRADRKGNSEELGLRSVAECLECDRTFTGIVFRLPVTSSIWPRPAQRCTSRGPFPLLLNAFLELPMDASRVLAGYLRR